MDSDPTDDAARRAPRPGSARAAAQRQAGGAGDAPPADVVRKPVNTLAIVPQAKKITPLFRKSYNVMLHLAQAQGMERDVFRAPISAVMAGVDFDSNDTALVKRHLRAMATTAVEWQSPTTGEGAGWAVSGLIGHAEIKRERGQNWLEWSYSVRLKQELLEPSVFARLSLEIISQLRSHGAIALYEICSRYRDVGRTSRQAWSWWRPVLSGKPETDKQKQLEYRFFKRDVLKTAIAEVSAVTDIEVELLEYKQGRFVADLQFVIRKKQQAALPLQHPPRPLDLSLVLRASRLGVDEERAEAWLYEHGEPALALALDALERRAGSDFPQPLRDPGSYLRTLLERAMPLMAAEPTAASGGGAARAAQAAQAAQAPQAPQAGRTTPAAGTAPAGHTPASASPQRVALPYQVSVPAPLPAATASERAVQDKRRAKWQEEWQRRRRDDLVAQIAALGDEAQQALSEALHADLEARNTHPSIRKRLQASGWRHPMVVQEMVRFFAQASIGSGWDKPTPEQLLEVASQLGDDASGDSAAPGTAAQRAAAR